MLVSKTFHYTNQRFHLDFKLLGNTISRSGIKQLEISSGSIFLLFSYESSQGPGSYIVAGGNPNPLALNNASPANADKTTTKLPSRY